MTLSDWIALAAVFVTIEIAIIGALVKHFATDAATRVRVEDAIKRLDKIDGNGSGKDRLLILEREVNQNLRPKLHELSNTVHVLNARYDK